MMTSALSSRAPAPHVVVSGDRPSVRFDRFGIDAYDLFLRAKGLPEYEVQFDQVDESYTITAPARFAGMLGVEAPQPVRDWLPLPGSLFDDQSAIVTTALAAKRYACWSDCGLGKTLIELEFARQVAHRTGKRVLIFTLNEIVEQTLEEARKFYGDTLPIHRVRSRAEMRGWCKEAARGEGRGAREEEPAVGITNYEKMNHKGLADQVVSELKHLGGVVLDESSRLKGGGGKQKWALIKSCRGIEYKLSCTATPAPNDTIEFASQASFLEKLRNEGDIIWTYFARDPKTHRWTVKRHAQRAFFDFMASWSIYVRNPKRYGWRMDHPEIPEPEAIVHEIDPTPEQVAIAQRLSVDATGQISMFGPSETNTVQRGKLSQLAKGFVYRKVESGKRKADEEIAPLFSRVQRVPSLKPAFVADLVAGEVAEGLQVLVWTVFDAESDIIAELLRPLDIPFDLLVGRVPKPRRLPILERFRHGESRVLVSRAKMVGWGMNFQCCGSMIFSGWNDSYESYYQAIRRAYRYGQTRRLRVHLPVVELLEGHMLENIFGKQAKHEAAIAEMEADYIVAGSRQQSREAKAESGTAPNPQSLIPSP